MLHLDIPGRPPLSLDHLVLDYNGTLARDGRPIEGVVPRLEQLGEIVRIHVVTADTFGTVTGELDTLPLSLTILEPENQDRQKAAYVRRLGPDSVVAVGNGRNDAAMLGDAALGLAVIQEEGAAPATLTVADAVFTHINHALDALLQPRRLVATLRR